MTTNEKTRDDPVAAAAEVLLAAAGEAGLLPDAPEGERLLARLVLVVDVVQGSEPARSTPDGYEHPYEYVCVREAVPLASTACAPTGILSMLDDGPFEDPDPDGALVTAVRDGLSELAPPDPRVEG